MTNVSIERSFRDKVCAQIRLEPEGEGRFRVFTPFMTDDGDHLAIVLKRADGQWWLTDEGHTFMHLTYALDERDLQKGTRQRIIANALSAFQVQDREGELVAGVADGRFGDALYSFIQALLRVADVKLLSREQVKSTFLEDFRQLIAEAVPDERRIFNWHDPDRDPQGNYMVDCRVNGRPRPLMIFALPNDDRSAVATISLLQFERWGLQNQSLAIFEDQEQIGRKVLARLSDVLEKQFSSLAGNQPRITAYLREALGSLPPQSG